MTALPEKLSWVCPEGVTPLHGGVRLRSQECLSDGGGTVSGRLQLL